MEEILIYGAGDLCLEVIWYIDQMNSECPRYVIKGILDDCLEVGTRIGSYSVLGGMDYFKKNKSPVNVVLAIAKPVVSKKIALALSIYEFITYPDIISPLSVISPDVKLGKGCIIPPGVIINVSVDIGDFVKIGQGALINHHCTIKDHSFVGPNATLTGHVLVGDSCFIGAAVTVLPELTINSEIIVGAGAVVVHNLNESGTYIGCPAIKIEKR